MTDLVGTSVLARAIVRRDRVRLVVWTGAIVLLVLVTAVSTRDIYPTQADLAQVARATEDNPAALALNGPPVALDTIGGQVSFQLGAFGLVMVALMTLLLTSRWTRGEEEGGRTELVRAMPVGRHAPLAAAVLVGVGLNVVVGILTTLSLLSEDLPVAGSVAIGASFLAVGSLFLALTTVTAQVSENARVASGLAGAALGVSYALRAVGDATNGALSWVSLVGIAQKSRPYGGEQWWPLVLCSLLAAGLLATAAALADRRDFGAGLLPPRPGPANGAPSLGTELGLAVRLQRATAGWWLFGVFVAALVFGSLAGSIEDFVADSEGLEDYFALEGGASLAEGYLATSLLLLCLIPAGAAVQMLLRTRTEELEGRAEAVLATPASRLRWFGGHVAVVVVCSSLAVVAAGAALGLAAAFSLGEAGELARITTASLAYLPALWTIIAATAAVVGLFPRAAYSAWGLWALCLVVAYFGSLVDFPAAVADLSPFQHVPSVPVDDVEPLPLVVLLAAAAGLATAGAAGLRRRDVGG